MENAVAAAAAVILAVALDLAFGDPPNALHPVGWLGRLIAAGRWTLCRGGPGRLLVGGAIVTLAVTALAALAGVGVAALATWLGIAGLILEAVALKSTLSLRRLAAAARSVAAGLERGDLDAARASLGHHLVSRPTAALGAGHVASGAVESVAENLTDSFVAPVCFFLVFGLPGAFAYRAINTADAILGYREGALEHFGKVAARLDDLLNLAPARLTALVLVLGAVLAGTSANGAWAIMTRDHALTASPNAGWTMAAMAGALGVTLEKPGHYRLGDGPLPVAGDIGRSLAVLGWAAAVTVIVGTSVRLTVG